MLIHSMGIREEEDNTAIYGDIPCVIYPDIPRTGLAKKKDSDCKDEVDPEPVLDFSFDERRDAVVVEAEVVDFIDD